MPTFKSFTMLFRGDVPCMVTSAYLSISTEDYSDHGVVTATQTDHSGDERNCYCLTVVPAFIIMVAFQHAMPSFLLSNDSSLLLSAHVTELIRAEPSLDGAGKVLF